MNVSCYIGKIYASFKPLRKAEALVVANDRILYLGSSSVAEKICEFLGGRKFDIGNRVIIPAFIDPHVHLEWIGETLNQLDLRGVKSIRKLKAKLKEFAESKKVSWIYGRGWDQEILEEKRYPNRFDLDEVVKDRPVSLFRVCGHSVVVNSKLIEMLGLRGEEALSGILKEMPEISKRYRESLSDEEIKNHLIDAMKFSVSQGVTTVAIAGLDLRTFRILADLERENSLNMRIRAYIMMNGDESVLRALKEVGIRLGYGSGMLKIMGFKIIADGALGIRTAYLTSDYDDEKGNRGKLNLKEDLLKKIIKEIHEYGFQLAIHAIGDATIDVILSAFEELDERAVKRLRHRIEHASVIREDQLERISKLGLVVSVQPHFVISDHWAMKRLGKERMRWLYPFKSMLIKGINLCISTDSPVEPLNPWETIYACITRGKYENLEHYEYIKDEKLELAEALHAYTLGSAYSLHEEKELGSLEQGKLADFLIIDRDPFELDDFEIKRIKVLETFIGGNKVY